MRIYLDDLRDIPVSKGFVGARNFEEAQDLIMNNKVEILSLDHDLGEDENGIELKSGYHLVKWICDYYIELNLSIEKIYIHSDNPVGRADMLETLLACHRRGFIDTEFIYHYPYTKNQYSEVGYY